MPVCDIIFESVIKTPTEIKKICKRKLIIVTHVHGTECREATIGTVKSASPF